MFAVRPFSRVSLKHTNVKGSRLFYATNILYEYFSKIAKCLIITPPLNKQQGDSEISENPVSYKKCFEKMFNVKEKPNNITLNWSNNSKKV